MNVKKNSKRRLILILDGDFKRVWKRPDGILKVEVWTLGRTGRLLSGEMANGHWKVRGYKLGDVFAGTLRELKEKLAGNDSVAN